MGSDFNNCGNDRLVEGEGGVDGWPPGRFALTRQPSVYSMTFDEFQSSIGGIGKDFGSMNMDELLKNIWSAEGDQNMGFTNGSNGQDVGGYLQRQGSLTLPRTLSQKTVDDVWQNISKEYGGGKNGSDGVGGSTIPRRQQTLGEITLEEFLVRAGVVRDDTQSAGKPSNIGGELLCTGKNTGLGFGYQQTSSIQIGVQSASLTSSLNGVGYTARQLVPNQASLAFGSGMAIPSICQLGSPDIRGQIAQISDAVSGNLVQNGRPLGGDLAMISLGVNRVSSPAVISDGILKSNGHASSTSPVPYAFNVGLRGRKSASLEKIIERRQKRMIKNRESASRSRARKQEYTMELEAEVAKLKEENQLLQTKQARILEIQKNLILDTKQKNGGKKRCLRRTLTGQW